MAKKREEICIFDHVGCSSYIVHLENLNTVSKSQSSNYLNGETPFAVDNNNMLVQYVCGMQADEHRVPEDNNNQDALRAK